jgi:predicted ATPase with chaperone activity
MLARRLTTILPALRLAEALETTRIHSVAGLTGARTAVVTTRPCRAPHHTISAVGLIGGGQVPLPGDVSLAHHGFLFLDEQPAFRRQVLEVLRQPLGGWRDDDCSGLSVDNVTYAFCEGQSGSSCSCRLHPHHQSHQLMQIN